MFLSFALPAISHGATKAERLKNRMIQLYGQKKYRQTIVVTKQLYELTKQSKYLVNIGRCYDLLKNDEEALRYYGLYLKKNPNSPLKQRLTEQMSEIRKRLSVIKRQVQFETSPSGAQIVIDGRILLTSPAIAWLTFGRHTVVIKKQGFSTMRETLRIVAGPLFVKSFSLPRADMRGRLTVTSNVKGANVFLGNRLIGQTPLINTPVKTGKFRLRVQASKYRDWSTTVNVEPEQRTVIQADLTRHVVTSKSSGKGIRIAAWTLTGLGAALLIGGGVLNALAVKKIKDANDTYDDLVNPTPDDTSKYNSDFDSGTGMYKGAIALYAIGGVSLVTGIVLFFIKPKSSESVSQRGRFRLIPVVGPGTAGFSANLRF